MMHNKLDLWKRRWRHLKLEAYTLYLAYKDPRVPWYAKILIICVVGYAFSPIDKLLDSIPIIGYLDHLVLVPIGVGLAFRRIIPRAVLADCRRKAYLAMHRIKPNRIEGLIIVVIVLLFTSLAVFSAIWVMRDWNEVLTWWVGRYGL